MISKEEASALRDEAYSTEKLAKIFVDHITNEKGEVLARIWENPGFREVYDYKGILLERRKLKRK